jgi:hypothetical protein
MRQRRSRCVPDSGRLAAPPNSTEPGPDRGAERLISADSCEAVRSDSPSNLCAEVLVERFVKHGGEANAGAAELQRHVSFGLLGIGRIKVLQ